jgi:hypothetical protein
MSQWIKCTERMPELDDDGHSEMVLALDTKNMIHLNFLRDDGWLLPAEVTHWMPLPELPEKE